jgi:hypothetical protein
MGGNNKALCLCGGRLGNDSMYKVIGLLWLAVALYGDSLCMGQVGPKSSCSGWESLQQLNSLMPERIWEQEFDMRLDCAAFEKKIGEWLSGQECSYTVARTNRYFLKTTMSGETSRLFDRYEEFEWSPYWKNLPQLNEFYSLEREDK